MSEEYINYNELEDMEYLCNLLEQRDEDIKNLKQENKQLKEQLENKIDLYEDTISYQLGFDKGKEYMQQALLDIKEYIENTFYIIIPSIEQDILDIVNKALGDRE